MGLHGSVRTNGVEPNKGPNSYWRVHIGPFAAGDEVTYAVRGLSPQGEVEGPSATFRAGPKLYLALLWHQHQPLYKDTSRKGSRGSYLRPWVRLHSIRDYYSMAALVGEHPGVHLTINLTPVLMWQLEDYLVRGATDQALELTLKPADTLTGGEREEILSAFFDADWHNQVFLHRRYKELFLQRQERRSFSAQEIRDLQMWFNLAWFGSEFRTGSVPLVTGETASVQRFIAQGRGFSVADVENMMEEQYKVMRAVIPLHRALQERGQIEVSTTPFHHPILPLLVDTDGATIDRPGASLPRRFAYPEDAEEQVRHAVADYRRSFGRPPSGMWPAEGAVSESVVPIFARQGVRWIATDRGVLARSGRWGYDVNSPDVLCQPYRAEAGRGAIAVFFRDTQLSDHIGFHYQGYDDYGRAAREFLGEIKERFARRVQDDADRILTVVLDGENAWGAYREDARPFLHALYDLLESDPEIATVSFTEYLDGDLARGIAAHPQETLAQVHNLFTASWIDENGSLPGVDLGTWIGEAEENRAWELLGQTRDALARANVTPETAPAAFEAAYTAEGSDWFWWFGEDQESGHDEEFDELFRLHLKNVYRGLNAEPPAALDQPIVTHPILWTFTQPVQRVQAGGRLTVRTNCPGVLTWQVDDGETRSSPLVPAGGAMAGAQHHHMALGPFPTSAREVRFRFRCTHPGCPGDDVCCSQEDHIVEIID